MAGRKSGNSINRYMMRQKIVAFGDDFYIENRRAVNKFSISTEKL